MKILEAETKKIKEAAVSVEEHTGITALVFGGNSDIRIQIVFDKSAGTGYDGRKERAQKTGAGKGQKKNETYDQYQ